MLLNAIKKNRVIKKFYTKWGNKWVENKVRTFIDVLPQGVRILDLGSGNCMVANYLMENGKTVTAIDVKNLSIIKEIVPVVYDGVTLPFKDDDFETVLVLTVLHHSRNPVELIREAKRVGHKIIIIEDTYKNKFRKLVTQTMDTIVNFGHSEMTYQNRNEFEWEAIFKGEGLNIDSKITKKVLLFFQQTTYHLSK